MVVGDVGHGIGPREVDAGGDGRKLAVLVIDAHVGDRNPRERLRIGVAAQTGQIDPRADGQRVGHLVVDIQPRGDPLPVVVHLDAVLTFVAAREVIAEAFAAARKREVVALLDAGLVDLVDPVRVGQRRGVVPDRVADAQLLHDADVVFGPEHPVHVRVLPHADVAREREFRLGVVGALLRRDEHHTASSPRTVDRRRTGILDHLDRLDVVQVVFAVVVAGHAVDHEERVQAVDRTHTADHDIGACTGFSAGLRDHHTGDLALQRLGNRPGGQILDVRSLDRGDGARQVGLLLRTVTDHHDVVEAFALLFEDDLQTAAVQHRQAETLITDIGDKQRGACGNRERETPVRTRNRTVHRRGILHDDRGSDQGISLLVGDRSGDGPVGKLAVGHRIRVVGDPVGPHRAGNAAQQEQDEKHTPAHPGKVKFFHRQRLGFPGFGPSGMPKCQGKAYCRYSTTCLSRSGPFSCGNSRQRVWKKSTSPASRHGNPHALRHANCSPTSKLPMP